MKLIKLSILVFAFLINPELIKAQSAIVFENVIQSTKIVKPERDSNYTYNFEYLNGKQIEGFGLGLKKLLTYRSLGFDGKNFSLFEDIDENRPYEPSRLRSKLVLIGDSVDAEMYDSTGSSYFVKMAGFIDSSWYFENIQGIEFKEDWIFDTAKFTCEIKNKMCMPLTLMYGKEELGPYGLFYIKPAQEQKNFEVVTDFIITDVYCKQDPMTENQIPIFDANTEIDHYKMVVFMNSTIDKIKAGKLKCFKPSIPFQKPMLLAELKPLFAEEFVPNKNERFPIRYKMFNYRFKLIEKWWFDPIALAFKKEALGMVLMKRNEKNDLSKNKNGDLIYTFKPVAYVPFNPK